MARYTSLFNAARDYRYILFFYVSIRGRVSKVEYDGKCTVIGVQTFRSLSLSLWYFRYLPINLEKKITILSPLLGALIEIRLYSRNNPEARFF